MSLRQIFATLCNFTKEELTLRELGIKYKRAPSQSIAYEIVVPGDIDLSGRGLTKLPDLSGIIVLGDYYCNNNNLTSLKGTPHNVRGSVYCQDNKLTSLNHGPDWLGQNLHCEWNPIKDLSQRPQEFKTIYSDLGIFRSDNPNCGYYGSAMRNFKGEVYSPGPAKP